MIRCQKCGYSNQLNAKHCVKCRTSLLKEEGEINGDPGQVNKKTIAISENDKQPWDQGGFQAAPKGSGVHTVRRVIPDHKSCYLVALSVDEEKEIRKIDLQGNSINLDRSLLDNGNTSISRNGHAKIYSKDGSWFIENTTALKTTFLQVNQPLKLSENDVILIGDSLFKFKMS